MIIHMAEKREFSGGKKARGGVPEESSCSPSSIISVCIYTLRKLRRKMESKLNVWKFENRNQGFEKSPEAKL